jgi:6-pyruvoyl-tetrahydropterin synthase
MKTEKQLLEKYKEMLINLDELNKFVKNPPEHTGFRTINKKIEEFNYQSDLCNFMTWVLDITEPHNVDDINEKLKPL